ncbi:MAG: hypothetical protein P8Y60_07110, partial [Calditrichota bacterium]
MIVPIGIANSVSANFGYDIFDALKYKELSNFDLIQIYLSKDILENKDTLNKLYDYLHESDGSTAYFHAEGFLNREFLQSEYSNCLFDFILRFEGSKLILHFDEKAQLEDLLEIISELSEKDSRLYLENFFQFTGKINAEKNIRKYLALFTLANSQQLHLSPVIDIPRFFNAALQFKAEEALQWCFELLNYFGNRGILMLLHLIDAFNSTQERNSYCSIGEGYIPYDNILKFMVKTRAPIEGIILEFEDKINPLKSRDYLNSILS